MSNENRKNFQARDTAILAGWIAGIITIAAFSWLLFQPIKNRFLVSAVNQALERSGDSRRLRELTRESPFAGTSGYFGMGAWFAVTTAGRPAANAGREGTTAFVFSFLGEGFFFPCAAVVNADGKLEEFIPLSGHGKKMMQRVSPGILKIYAKRIEGMRS